MLFKIKKANFEKGKISENIKNNNEDVELKHGFVERSDYDLDFEKFKSLEWLK